ncbi:anti-CBASS protein Acb1 family protein [Vibrio paracholerae]|uniref:anti-CBASS protein Acb1 family protein n=1 Tax=Vibrio paracholerae TaxID=650003 RepID=UPI00209453EE|nr:anti-CBASS Acb1 family protein [Vibrio paracholerae]MCO7020301.1 DUF1073 domain-containing protein [Vibrio paracholerae]
MSEKLEMAVNHARMLAANSYQSNPVSRAREALLAPMGMDHKRSSAWCEYGWKEVLNFHDLYGAYRRGGLAFSAVNKLVNKCWSSFPEVIEGEEKDESSKLTTWEKQTKKVLTKKLWAAFAEADRRRLVGRYAGILIHFRDSKKWNEPVEKSGRGIEKFTVAWGNCLTVKEFNSDIASVDYGQPKMWSYTESLPNGGKRMSDVHPDRVFIVGDYTIDAIGFLEPGYNALTNIEKVEGGSGESFLKNAARQLNVNFDKEIDFNNLASLYGVSVSDLQDKFNEVAVEVNKGNDVLMTTQGATVTPLVASIPDPTPTYDINLQTFAASVDIPSRILVGNQQAERSSTEDNKHFNGRCQSRREMELSSEIEGLVDKLIDMGSIKPIIEFSVIWDDLSEATQSDKLANAKVMTEINDKSASTGSPIFGDDEIRNAAGFESMEDTGTLPDTDPELDNGNETEGADTSA